MYKRLSFFLIVFIAITVSYIGYIKFTNMRIEEYLSYYNSNNLKGFFNGEIQGEAKLVRVIKRSPKELIMIIKWDNYKAYASVENWLTRAHDNAELNIFDNSKSINFYE